MTQFRTFKRVLIIGSMMIFTMLAMNSFAAEETARTGAGIKIWFDLGGPVGETYSTIVYNGAKAAANDLGCDIEFMYSDWNPEKMIENFKKAMAAKPDGIAVMGHPGDDTYEPFIKEAIDSGILVTSVDTELPRLLKNYKSTGFGYAGEDNYLRGVMLGEEVVRRFGLKAGEKAFVWGLKSRPTRGLSTTGIIESLEKAGLKVDYFEITPEIDADTSLGTPVMTGYLSANPDCKLIVTDHGALTAQLENFLRAAGLGPDAVYAAGFSLSPATISAIRSGYVDLVAEGQPFMQGYFGVLQLVMAKKYGFNGFAINTSGGLVYKENVEVIAPLVEKGIR